MEKTAVLEQVRVRTPTKQLVIMQDIVHAVVALPESPAIRAVDLPVEGGWVLL